MFEIKINKVKKLMFLKGMLANDLAKTLDISPNYMSRIMNNKVNVSPRLAKNMSATLGVEISDIFEVKETVKEG